MIIDDKLKDHILNSIGEGVLTVDKEFRINFINKAAEKMLGYQKEEVIGQFCKYILKSGDCFSNCPVAGALKSEKNIFGREYRIKNKQGQSIPLRINSSVLYNGEGEPIGGILSFQDCTELEELKKNLKSQNIFHGIVGNSKQMQEIFELIREIDYTDAPVFIQGESGTGKELVANAIQAISSRKNEAFVKVNCSVFPENLLPSELFGHVKGAFTDAGKDRVGRFELANRGTIFLDEVAEMPLQMQIQILRVLQEGTFERVGESSTRHVDVRVIAATNINIDEALANGRFREDLFYRLNVIPITVPPLRERKEDIIQLVNYFLNKFSVIYKKEIFGIENNALDILMSYHWPGNIRELENILEYSFVRTTGELILKDKLPPILTNNPKGQMIMHRPATGQEKENLLQLMQENFWNKTLVAKKLGIGRTTLWRKLKKYGIDN